MLPIFPDLISPSAIGGSGAGGAAIAVAFSAAVEFTVIYIFARRIFSLSYGLGRIALAGIIPTIVTLGAIAASGLGVIGSSPAGLLGLEAGVVFVEALMIVKFLSISFKRAAAASFAANLASLVIGVFLGF